MSALATYWQATTVADALVATDFHLALDVLLDLTSEVTFNAEVAFDIRAELSDVLIV